MEYLKNLTGISRIGKINHSENEWTTFTKKFNIEKLPEFAAIRVDSQGVCGIYLNGEFIEASCGRFVGRITYVECTSKLKVGENELTFEIGGHYYQTTEEQLYSKRGFHFSAVAAELEMISGGNRSVVVTDSDFVYSSDEGEGKAELFAQITKAEYERFWKAAALWHEPKTLSAPKEILDVAGEGYAEYIAKKHELYKNADKIEKLNGMKANADGSVETTGEKSEDGPYVIYDLGRLHVGYMEIEYESQADGTLIIKNDFTEDISDFDEDTLTGPVKLLVLNFPVKKGKNKIFVHRRRAGRYIFVKVNGDNKVKINSVRVRLSMKPQTQTGWFNSEDEVYNKMWEVGKYTLHVNKHREYESCPRSEMKYFACDGSVDELIDLYAFGEDMLLDSSLAITEIFDNGGLVRDRFERNNPLWDIPGWRIITVYNHYFHTGDTELVRRYYDELKLNLEWMMDKMSSDYLIYQFPVYGGLLYMTADGVDFTGKAHRLGYKPYLNAVYYACLDRMSKLGKIVGDADAEYFAGLSEKVKTAINEHLWSEKDGAYLNGIDTSDIPQEGNAIALYFGIPDEKRAETIKQTLCKVLWSPYGSALTNKRYETEPRAFCWRDSQCVSPFTNFYEAIGRFETGDAGSALDLMKRLWGTMLNKGAGTFWEYAPNNPTDRWLICAHAWAGGCTYLLSAYVLGIRPGDVGYETLLFSPCEEFEGAFSGVVPTVKGLVAVRKEIDNGQKVYTLAVPVGTKIEPHFPKEAKLNVIEY